jgi:hypothetical protein
MGVASRRAATPDKVDDCSGVKPPSGEERHIGSAIAGEIVDQNIVVTMREIVQVLHADDLADPAAFGDLRWRDIAQADMADQPLALKFGQHGERRLD